MLGRGDCFIVYVYVLNECRVFELREQYVLGDTLTSCVLADLAIPVNDLFVPEAAAET